MQNLDQIRARNALNCAEKDGSRIAGPQGGEVIKKIPSLILNHGLLATAAYAFTQKEGWQLLFNHIACHLADPDIGIVGTNVTEHRELMKYLTGPSASSETLKLATAETLAWLSYARRFVKEELIMPQIPITCNVAALIGDFAEGVQNRSLLLEKFVFHKKWGLDDFNANDAHRWSLMRMSDGGANDLTRDAQKRSDEARRLASRNPEKSERLQLEAGLAQRLASTQAESQDARELRRNHSRRLVGLVRSAFGQRASITIAALEGRLAINLAEGLLQNAGICLDRLFGLPYIPGSAVKGVCRHAALAELKAANGSERQRLFLLFRRVFGTADTDFAHGDLKPFLSLLGGLPENQKGAVTFLPAHPVDDAKVVVDLTNVHYPTYYGGDRKRGIQPGKAESLAEERPQPNPFPAVESGARFAFLLLLNGMDQDASLLRASEIWLQEALTIHGLGAKTACGYGWFSLDSAAKQAILDEEAKAAAAVAEAARRETEARARAEAEARRLAALSPAERACDLFKQFAQEPFAKKASELSNLDPAEQKGLLLALLTPEKKDTWKTWKKSDKPANKTRVEAISKAATQHGIKLP